MAYVHPYKGYLNTDFHFYTMGNENVEYNIFSNSVEEKIPIQTGVFSPNIPHSIKINKAGSFLIDFSDGTSSEIIVEDGYKFGGGKHKTSFIFDNCPWVFVIMHDRTYFYNRVTKEQYVEAISPDYIKPISDDYVILENNGQREQSIYSLVEQRPILTVSGIIFTNEKGIVWIEGQDSIRTIKSFSFDKNKIITTVH